MATGEAWEKMCGIDGVVMRCVLFFFFFNDTATTEIYTLSLHDALPISQFQKPSDDFLLLCLRLGTLGCFAGWAWAHLAKHQIGRAHV